MELVTIDNLSMFKNKKRETETVKEASMDGNQSIFTFSDTRDGSKQ